MTLIGARRHRVEILESNESGTSDLGEVANAWPRVKTVWAAVEPLGGRELLRSQQPLGEQTHRVRMLYLDYPHLHAGRNRLRYGGRVLEISTVINVGERDAEFEILCKETT